MQMLLENSVSRADVLQAIDDSYMIVLADREGRVISANEKFCTFFGYESDELLGSSFLYLDESCSQEDRLNFWQGIGQSEKYEKRMFRRAKNGEHLWVNTIIFPVKSSTGSIKAFLVMMTNITELKRAEEAAEKAQNQLLQAQKMEDIGRLASGIAHDFNNILMPIMGFTELSLIAVENNESEKIVEYLTKTDKFSKRAAHLVEKMLTFSRENSARKRRAINPIAILEEILELGELLRSGIGTSIALMFEDKLQNSLSKIVIDTAELYQVITNLIVNAHDAIASVQNYGKIKITLSKKLFTGQENFCCVSCQKKMVGDYIIISVQDTGHGISIEDIKKIFDPFFTTKEKGKGTGLGLSMVNKIVHEVDAHIIVESTINIGTTFSLFFPVVVDKSDNEALPRVYADSSDLNYKLKICVIDDDEPVRTILDISLTKFGHQVKTFAGAVEALRYFENNVDYFDLIITDYRMPIMNGDEFAEKVFKYRPQIPIIFCTGYSDLLGSEEDLPKGNTVLIYKPIGITKMNSIIKELFIGN